MPIPSIACSVESPREGRLFPSPSSVFSLPFLVTTILDLAHREPELVERGGASAAGRRGQGLRAGDVNGFGARRLITTSAPRRRDTDDLGGGGASRGGTCEFGLMMDSTSSMQMSTFSGLRSVWIMPHERLHVVEPEEDLLRDLLDERHGYALALMTADEPEQVLAEHLEHHAGRASRWARDGGNGRGRR